MKRYTVHVIRHTVITVCTADMVLDGALEIASGGSVGPISKSGREIETPVGPISD